MSHHQALEEYGLALKQGQKELSELLQAGKPTEPAVLDDILENTPAYTTKDIGLQEVPSNRIVGTKTAGRIAAFTPSFLPILDIRSEFGTKWVHLCEAHLSDVGIRDPIVCYEYLGQFYVQEGNKRVSVLRYFGAERIPALVTRILPPLSDDPRIIAYYEFLDFFKSTNLYLINYRRPLDYAKLLSHLGRKPEEIWTEDERRNFKASFQYFCDAFQAQNTTNADILPEEALLVWLQVYPFQALREFSATDLKKSLAALWDDVLVAATPDAVKVQTQVDEAAKPGLLSWITLPDHLNVAFVHQLDPVTSGWVLGHERGKKHIEKVFGDKITVRSYYDANSPELADARIEQAVANGAQVVFTTAPLLRPAALKAAVRYPKVQFLNCSVDQPYSSVRSYYGRVYEAKFITGAIAGALAQNDRIGYIASYPTLGQAASINAFALGAQMTNPRAQLELRWSCVAGTPQQDFFDDGIRVISNRDAPVQTKRYLDFCSYGTYLMDDMGSLISLGSPLWIWGKFYELVLKNMFAGTWKNDKAGSTALNYWLGMDSGVIDLQLSDNVPEGLRSLASLLQEAIRNKTLDPFLRKIRAQDGSLKSDGTAPFTPDALLRMDWLCENIVGSIPDYEEILPMSRPMVRELGLYRDILPAKEGKSVENTDRF